MRILVVEDSNTLRSALERGLRKCGFCVDTAADGEAGLDLALVHSFDVIVLDLMLPKCDGMEVLRQMRAAKADTPVLILTAMADVEHRVAGINAGADDYLVKPFAFAELLARVRALIRRRFGGTANAKQIGNLRIDAAAGRAFVADTEVAVQPREFALLDYLSRREGHIASRSDIMEHLYDHNTDLHSNAIDSAVSKLRKALREAGAAVEIRAIPRRGYCLEAAGEAHDS